MRGCSGAGGAKGDVYVWPGGDCRACWEMRQEEVGEGLTLPSEDPHSESDIIIFVF